MKIEQVRECQLWQLDALKFIDKLCRENNLKYFAHTGTLLGAARHSGYVPWDMDTDILMPYEDCQKLIKIIKAIDDPNYSVIAVGEGRSSADKVVAFTVKCYGKAAIDEKDKFIHVDVYAYDYAKKHISPMRKFYSQKQRLVNRLISYRAGRREVGSISNRCILKIFSLLNKNRTDQELRESVINKAVSSEMTDFVTVFNSFYGFGKETYPKCFFDEVIELPFEDISVPVSKYYDDILTKLYGNWRQFPPEDRRYPDYLDELIYEVIGKKEDKG